MIVFFSDVYQLPMSLLENLQAALGFLNNGDVLGDAL